MANAQFYQKPVAVNRDIHRHAKIGPVPDFGFATKINCVALTLVEFTEACKEYPIVFAAIGERHVPVALLGLREHENLYVDGAGKWEARYIPASVRRYPFVLAENGSAGWVVCVDEASSAFNAAGGQPLFDEAGKNTALLDGALNFLRAFQTEFARTDQFVKTLDTHQLLTEMSAKFDLKDGRSFVVKGLHVIDEKKFKALDSATLHALVQSADAAWIYAHLISMSNLRRLIDHMAGRT
jgi:hypothetical protein